MGRRGPQAVRLRKLVTDRYRWLLLQFATAGRGSDTPGDSAVPRPLNRKSVGAVFAPYGIMRRFGIPRRVAFRAVGHSAPSGIRRRLAFGAVEQLGMSRTRTAWAD